jgi:hypothetical protein
MSHKISMIGVKVGLLEVIAECGRSVEGKALWRCKCQCGNSTTVTGRALRAKTTKSCGCLKHVEGRGMHDLSTQRFGRLTAIERAGRHMANGVPWRCLCECGNEIVVPSGRLKSGNTKSCGCLSRDITGSLRRTHGMSRSSEYASWTSMKDRCFNPNNDDYALYGGRGITVCRRWKNSFENFLADMGTKPFPRASIDRINTNGNYSPTNCRWSSQKTQTRNKRTNKVIEFDGHRRTVAEWAERTGLHRSVIEGRIARGWPLEEVLSPERKTKWSRRKPNR